MNEKGRVSWDAQIKYCVSSLMERHPTASLKFYYHESHSRQTYDHSETVEMTPG